VRRRSRNAAAVSISIIWDATRRLDHRLDHRLDLDSCESWPVPRRAT
jgi:hypothetical protein